MKLESEYDVRGYYDVFNDASNASNVQTLSVGRDVNSRGGGLYNNSFILYILNV